VKRSDFKYTGVFILIQLHEKHMRLFVETWKKAKERNVILPETDDPDYESLDKLLLHLLRSSRGYITWICEKLGLPDPKIDPETTIHNIDTELDDYLNYLLEKWQTPLMNVEKENFWYPVYKTKWGPEFGIEAMLEHAVMHPIRHHYQLERL
jgi:hypothetical protein